MTSRNGLGLPLTLFIIFLIHKLNPDIENWSWWWVTSPLWITFLLALLIAVIAVQIRKIDAQ